jgi:hypothetical protein
MDRQRFKFGGRRNGAGKWVATTAHTLRLRRSIPFGQCARKAVLTPPASTVLVSTLAVQLEKTDTLVCNPMDTWFEVEDLWSRLARICHATVVDGTDAIELSFANVCAEDWDDHSVVLIDRALYAKSYHWCHSGSCGNFVQCVEFRGADLVLTLTSLQQMTRWPDAENFKPMVERFLLRLQRGGASC